MRIAEFAWVLMEPAEGEYEFGWLHRAVDTLHKHQIAVILGTPSAAPPPWLTTRYPDIIEVNSQGQRLHPGGRLFTCPTNSIYSPSFAFSAMAKVQQALDVPPGVELTVRRSAAREWVFLLNHTAEVLTIPLSKPFADLITGEEQTEKVQLSAYGVRVLEAS